MTGWNLPPGCTYRDIDELAGVYDMCDVCGQYVDNCVCPNCACGEYGRLKCYEAIGDGGHGMRMNKAQALKRQETNIRKAREQVADEEQVLIWMESDEQEWWDLKEV